MFAAGAVSEYVVGRPFGSLYLTTTDVTAAARFLEYDSASPSGVRGSSGISLSMVLQRVFRFVCGIFLCAPACGLRASLRQRGIGICRGWVRSVETLGFLMASREAGLDGFPG